MKTEENISVLPYNTFGIDVRAAVVAEYESVDELAELLRRYAGMPILPIGEGSNLLFTGDYDGVLLRSRMQRARAIDETADDVLIEAEAGLKTDELIAQLTDMDLRGMENLSHIPGTVGASAVQNVGAYGVEAKDVIEQVKVWDRQDSRARVCNKEECGFGYRDSRFKHEWRERYVVTSVVYRLRKGGELNIGYGGLGKALAGIDARQLTAADVRRAVIEIRRSKLPEVGETGSAGSFFKNPVIGHEQFEALQRDHPTLPSYEAEGGVKVPAAWLIEQCGLKGMRIGGAQVYEKQPLVIVNRGNATAQDIVELAQKVTDTVQDKFGIKLVPEVNYV